MISQDDNSMSNFVHQTSVHENLSSRARNSAASLSSVSRYSTLLAYVTISPVNSGFIRIHETATASAAIDGPLHSLSNVIEVRRIVSGM